MDSGAGFLYPCRLFRIVRLGKELFLEPSKEKMDDTFTRRTFLGAALAGAAALPFQARRVSAQSSRPNFVVIVLDTARRDHLSCYGYERDTTPFLRELANESRVYQNAYSTSCWTVPSHASLFTGLYPTSHATTWENCRLDGRLTTIAELLQRNGYRTAGICENPILNAGLGFTKGFQSYSILPQLPQDPESPAVRRLSQEISAAGDQPFFIFANLVGPHDPYSTSGPFLGAYLSDPTYEKRVRIDLLGTIMRGKPLDQKWLEHLTEHYDAELRYCDFTVESMANSLKRSGHWENTVFVVLADHGENLGDHGFVNHQFCLYESLIRIPLIIRFPECFAAGSEETKLVQIHDIFPTLLALAGIDPAAHPSQGVSLLPGWPAAERPVLSEYYIHARFRNPRVPDKRWKSPRVRRHMRRLKSIRIGNMKLIQGSDGMQQLYDLGTDPDELRDLSNYPTYTASRDFLTRRLNVLVEQCKRQHPSPVDKPAVMDQDAEETLKAMGYL